VHDLLPPCCVSLLLLLLLPCSFELRVDPTKLPPGLHYAEVHGCLPDQEWRGPLFRVPITVIKPQDLLTSPDIDTTESAAAAGVVVQTPSGVGGPQSAAAGSSGSSSSESVGGALPPHTVRLGPVKLTPGQEMRHFVAVPAGATWAELLVRAGDYDTPKVFLIRWVGRAWHQDLSQQCGLQSTKSTAGQAGQLGDGKVLLHIGHTFKTCTPTVRSQCFPTLPCCCSSTTLLLLLILRHAPAAAYVGTCRGTQVIPDVRYTDSELRTNLTLSPNSEWSTAFKVGGASAALRSPW
jgi:hypothetical protein